MEIPATSSDEMYETGFTVDTRPFVDPYALTRMRNKHYIRCYKCGAMIEPEKGFINRKELMPKEVQLMFTSKEKWVAECEKCDD